jgi:cytochrome c-type biogenesis protein CcmE
MKHKAIRIGITSLVLALAFGGLLYSTLSEGTEYYKHVDEVMVDPEPWQGRRLQLHGFASDVRRKPNTLEYRFDVHNNGHMVKATYTGVVPDTFKDGAEVVLKGSLSPEGFHVVEDGVMAKCPSKYEPGAVGAPVMSGSE